MSPRISALAVIVVTVLSWTSAQENAEYEGVMEVMEGFSNDTFADSNGEEAHISEVDEALETTTEMPPEPGKFSLARYYNQALT